MSDVMADRREAPRYALILSAEVVELASATTLAARSSDVSRTGCYIDTLNPIPVGSQVKVQLRRGDTVFETSARVVYVCPGLGMGLHWGSTPAPEKMAILDRWLMESARTQT
jgi:PilZ domain